jgi:hypothetical protein
MEIKRIKKQVIIFYMQVTSIFHNDSENVTSVILPLTRATVQGDTRPEIFKEPGILVFTGRNSKRFCKKTHVITSKNDGTLRWVLVTFIKECAVKYTLICLVRFYYNFW